MSEVKKLTEQANKYGSITVTLDVNEVMTLLKERDALAAEMSVMDAIHDKCVFITDDDYDACPKSVQEIIRSLAVMQIPATDAYLNSVRAEGVEMWVDQLNGVKGWTVSDAENFAAQLRAGEPS